MENGNYERTDEVQATAEVARIKRWVYKCTNYDPDLRMYPSYNGKLMEYVYSNIAHEHNPIVLLNGESVTHDLRRQFSEDFPNVVALNTVFTNDGEARVLCLKSA